MLAGVFPPSIGGIQTHTLHLARRLVQRGINVHVLTRHHPGLSRYERIDGVSVHRVGDPSLPRGIRAASYLGGALAKVRELRDEIDVLHAHQLFGPTLAGYLGRAMLSKPLVINPHSAAEVGILEAQGVSGQLHLAAARRCADAFISICTPITVELRRAGIDDARIHAIPNGVDTNLFRPLDPRERTALRERLGLPQQPLVVYAGRLAHVKGVDVLLKAWPALHESAALCIVGDGEDGAALREQAALLQRVKFVGRLDNPLPFLQAADVAVIPSRSEGLSVALLEAMSCGLPTVATAVGGTPDVLTDGSGILTPPEDPQSLAEALRRALQEPSLGQAARARILARHSMDRVADQFLALYQSLCPARTAGAPIAS